MTLEQKAEEYAKPHTQPDEYWYPNCAVTDLRRKAFIAGYTMRDGESQWVSVETELPKEGVKVLVLGEQSGMNPSMGGAYAFIAYRIETNKNISKELRHKIDVNGFLNVHYVTHWLPLPTRL